MTRLQPAARRTAGFWLLALTLVVFFAASSAPSPLYVVYQARWGFSARTLTAVFAVYAVLLLAALLTVGGLSDFLGRRRVLAAALVLELGAMAAFLTAGGVGGLLFARGLQGVATGVAAGALSAAITDLGPSERPALAAAVNTASSSVGLAVGALTSGLLVQYAPAPRTLVYAVLCVLFVALLGALVLVPETVVRHPGALGSLAPRVRVPARARPAFRAAAPVLVATWAVGGLVLSLGPSLAAGVLGVHNHVVGGLVVSAVTAVAALGSVLTRTADPGPSMVRGAAVLVVGVAVVMAALALTSTVLFFVGLVVSGWGFGVAFVGVFGSLGRLADPDQRAEMFAAVFVVSYLSFGGSAVLAGLAVPSFGLRPTALVYGGIVIVLALSAAFAGRRRSLAPAGVAD